MKSTQYYNRYNDCITFTHENNTVTMTGYNSEWLRYGFANDYSQAYELYLLQCKHIQIQGMTYQEFAHEVMTNDDYIPYLKHVTSDTDIIDTVDPSGGPYLQVGSNLKMFFNDQTDRVIQHITINNDKVIFTL